MHAAANVAEEWPFQVDAQGTGADWSLLGCRLLNCCGEPFQRSHNLLFRRGDRGWQIGRYPMLRQECFETGKAVGARLHHVVPHAAMNMNVKVCGSRSEEHT